MLNIKKEIKKNNLIDIERDVCLFFGANHFDLIGKSRRKSLVNARVLFSYKARHETTASLREIGEYLGGRPSSTIVYYLKKRAAFNEDEKCQII